MARERPDATIQRIELTGSTAPFAMMKHEDGDAARVQIGQDIYDYEVVDDRTLDLTWLFRIGHTDGPDGDGGVPTSGAMGEAGDGT